MTIVSHVRTSAGRTLAISASTQPATYDVSGFSSLTYVTIGELSDMSAFGKKYNLVTFMPLGSRAIVKRRGAYNNGTMALKGGYYGLDAGQVAIQSALTSDTSSSFRVVTQSGSTYYFTAQTMSFVLEVGTVDQITGFTCDLELDNDIIPTNITA